MRYDIVHTTHYEYTGSVSVSHHLARLAPRMLPRQTRTQHELQIDPEPEYSVSHVDYFGNTMAFFAIQSAHEHLTVRATSRVEVGTVERPAAPGPLWDQAVDKAAMPLDALECVVDSTPPRLRSALADYAHPSLAAGRPLLDAVEELTARIYDDFTYDASATTVATSLAEVFESRRGVCQDFARLEIACLRACGLPARYVSGYLETTAVAGVPRLAGADASHAWLAVYGPGIGWVDVDPTNNLFPSDRHVTLAWGRDYGDVSPIRGVILGGGDHSLQVSVDVSRVEESAA